MKYGEQSKKQLSSKGKKGKNLEKLIFQVIMTEVFKIVERHQTVSPQNL